MKKYLLAFSAVYYLLSISCLYAAGIHSVVKSQLKKLDKKVLEGGGGGGSGGTTPTTSFDGNWRLVTDPNNKVGGAAWDTIITITNSKFDVTLTQNVYLGSGIWALLTHGLNGIIDSKGKATGSAYATSSYYNTTGGITDEFTATTGSFSGSWGLHWLTKQ